MTQPRPARRRLAAGLGLAVALAVLLAAPAAAAGPVPVHVGLHVLSVGNYDANKGTYTMDLYLVLAWDPAGAPANFTPERFEFMNGRAASKELLYDAVEDGERQMWYRIQANLYSEPSFREYPFDVQRLRLELEDAVHPATELVYVADGADAELDADARIAGWHVRSESVRNATKEYAFGEAYSRYTYEVAVDRPALGVGLRSILPPAAFVVIAGIAFFLHPSKVANRLTLGTSMVISAVGFHVSQTVALPSLPNLTLFDEVMVAVYLFIAASLGVTTLIAVNEDHWKREGFTRRANRVGGAVTVAFALGAFLVLRAL